MLFSIVVDARSKYIIDLNKTIPWDDGHDGGSWFTIHSARAIKRVVKRIHVEMT